MMISRNAVLAVLRRDGPPRYVRAWSGSVAHGLESMIRELLAATPTMPATVIGELIGWPCWARTSPQGSRRSRTTCRSNVQPDRL